MICAVTITYNRLELTKKTFESFYSKTNVDYHLVVDNGSTDGTKKWLEGKYDLISFDKNYGIARAFQYALNELPECSYVLKLDNDLEIVSEVIVEQMAGFLDKNPVYAVSPVDLMLDKDFKPRTLKTVNIDGYNLEYTTHTGGAFQLARYEVVLRLCREFYHLSKGDYMIGHFYRKHGIQPAYMTDLQIKHTGLNQSCNGYIL